MVECEAARVGWGRGSLQILEVSIVVFKWRHRAIASSETCLRTSDGVSGWLKWERTYVQRILRTLHFSTVLVA